MSDTPLAANGMNGETADQKIDRLTAGLLFLATVLRERHVLSDEDVKRMRAEYQVFPSLDRT